LESKLEGIFTSLQGGDHLRSRVLELISEASELARRGKVDLHIMTFSFTDEDVAVALSDAAKRCPSMTIRILADWSQRFDGQGQQVTRLVKLCLPNLMVRYKSDQPYVWSVESRRVRWSYRVSRGLLHHKTLGVLVEGWPWKLICGSFNWTINAARSYENLLIVNGDTVGSQHLMSRVELEFEALWSDGQATLAPEEAMLHYQSIISAYHADPTVAPESVVGLASGNGDPLRILKDKHNAAPHKYSSGEEDDLEQGGDEPRVFVAFSSRRIHDNTSANGYACANRTQRFWLQKPSGKSKRVPVTLTTLALDMIFRAQPGDTLKIAMYGLSQRVPEYGALLDAARRGVRLLVLLDGKVGTAVAMSLETARRLYSLSIEVRSGSKTMHQKYVIHPNSGTVLTGTANMTTDSSLRHSEQRILVRGCPRLAEQFSADFDVIWGRLSGKPS
jgi:hypothetical protein